MRKALVERDPRLWSGERRAQKPCCVMQGKPVRQTLRRSYPGLNAGTGELAPVRGHAMPMSGEPELQRAPKDVGIRALIATVTACLGVIAVAGNLERRTLGRENVPIMWCLALGSQYVIALTCGRFLARRTRFDERLVRSLMFAVAAFTTIGLWFATSVLLPRDVTCIDFCGIGWYGGIQISFFAGTIALMRAALMGALPPARQPNGQPHGNVGTSSRACRSAATRALQNEQGSSSP